MLTSPCALLAGSNFTLSFQLLLLCTFTSYANCPNAILKLLGIIDEHQKFTTTNVLATPSQFNYFYSETNLV